MKIFNEGERVCSTLMGFYSGLPGTIIRADQAQYDIFDNDNKYVIELDIGRTTKRSLC